MRAVGGRTGEVAGALIEALCWVAAADGRVTTEERAALAGIGQQFGHTQLIEEGLASALSADSRALLSVCRVLRRLDAGAGKLVVELSIGVALADGTLVPPENHIIRLFADVVRLGDSGLQRIFKAMTGHPFPDPSDLSDPKWWEGRERQSRGGSAREQVSEGAGSLPRLRDLAMLGLDESASEAEIRQAYRRMAQIHHPDRFCSLGPEAVAQADATFRRINAAYNRLLQ